MHQPKQALESLTRADELASEIYDSTSAELIPAKAALGIAYLEAGDRTAHINTTESLSQH